MAKRIMKKLGGERLGSGNKMMVGVHGYGYSTHDVSKVRRTSMSFGTIVPMGQWLMTSGSRMRMRLDALITSNALTYQLYGTAKFQLDVFSARMAIYNPKMQINLNDQGYTISDVKFPLMNLKTKGVYTNKPDQINNSALFRYLGIAGNGYREAEPQGDVSRNHNAMWMLMYYQTVKEYYANKQEKIGMMIHNSSQPSNIYITQCDLYANGNFVKSFTGWQDGVEEFSGVDTYELKVHWESPEKEILESESIWLNVNNDTLGEVATDVFDTAVRTIIDEFTGYITYSNWNVSGATEMRGYRNVQAGSGTGVPQLTQYDLKEIDKMTMRIMSNVESTNALVLNAENTALPYGASFRNYGEWKSINGSQEGLCLGTYQSDVFNNWLDNATINALNNKSKVKVDENGEFSIDMLNITQKLYNLDQRIGLSDGTLDDWRELTYGQRSKSKSLKTVYNGGLTKEIVFDQVVSTASTAEEPLGSIASRGQFGSKHKGGYVQIEADEETLVMVLAKITPRIVYNQGNDWTTNLKTLEDLHKPALDKIGYQNLITDQMVAFETIVNPDGSLTTFSAGKQPAWMWYRTNYDDALGNMADIEDYKVFGRSYELGDNRRIKDLTTYIDPMKYNDVFAIKSLDAMHFDVQVGMDVMLTNVMSEEVIPNL